jgi:sialate O-acetylesterase
VVSNAPGVTSGDFPEGCNIEFWDCNYGGGNAAGIPGATDLLDFGDTMGTDRSPGYSCMQIHNWQEQHSILCFNKFGAGRSADVGFGNSEGRTRDWTFTSSARDVARAQFLVLVLP